MGTGEIGNLSLDNPVCRDLLKKPGFPRRCKVVDEVARGALPVHHRPTNDAVRMANALLLEQVLGTGQFKNASRLATQIGISKNVVSELLSMLNKPVAEIERLLFEVK